MGTMSIDGRLPEWMVFAGGVLIILMAAGMIACIMRDITQMRCMWRSASACRRREAEEKQRKREEEWRVIEARILENMKPPKADCAGAKKRHGVDLRETDLRIFTTEENKNDYQTGIPKDHLQRAGYPDAVPCGSEG